jgi:hypothetical protein
VTPTAHPFVFRRAARAKRNPDRVFVPLRYQPWPGRKAIEAIFAEAQQLRRVGK